MNLTPNDVALCMAALRYAQRGWRVFPITPGEKAPPLLQGWQEHAAADPAAIEDWWTRQYVGANVGICCLGSNLTILDEDPDKGGRESLAALEAKFGSLPVTFTTRTPRGGRHFYFVSADGVKNSVSKIGPGLDVRSDVGYVVGPPSTWTNVGQWALFVEMEPVIMPMWLHELMLGANDNPPPKGGQFVERKGTRRTDAEWAKKLKGARKGERQETLAQVVGKAVRNNPPEMARQIAHNWAAQCETGDGPLTEKDVDDCVDRILAREQAKGQRDPDDAGGERYTDMANAQLLAAEAEGKIAHADEMASHWLVYDGTRLKEEPRHAIVPFVKEVAQRLYREAKVIEDEDQRELKLRGAAKLESRVGCDAAIELAQAQPALRIKIERLDQHPLWLNTPSGTLDLATDEMHAHRFEDFITHVTDAPYEPEATCPGWLAFLEEVLPDAEVRAFMQRSVGYALTDSIEEQCLWLLHGSGRNGKSTFLNVLRRVLGDYAASTHASTLMVKKHGDDKRNDLAALRGSRLVTVSESETGQQLAEALLKQLTGGDPLTVRKLYAEFFSFTPSFKIFIACNHKPDVRGQDLAIWRRIHLVPFDVTIPLDRVDPNLVGKLVAEGPGILAWMVEGFKAWQQDGLRPPEAVIAATEQYKHESDVLADFLETSTVRGPAQRATAQELFTAYLDWARRTGTRYTMNQKMLGTALEERGFQPVKVQGARGWQGLGVLRYVPS